MTTRRTARTMVGLWMIAALSGCAGTCRFGGGGAAAALGGQGRYTAAEAEAFNTVVASLIERAKGECAPICLNGLVCDHASLTCVTPPPCGGRCANDERCEGGAVLRCVPILGLSVRVLTDRSSS